jgi:hypothetical protein
MKNLLMMLSLALTLSVSAQNFEGGITWSVRYTANDTTVLKALKQSAPISYVWAVRDGNYRMAAVGSNESSDLLWLADKQQYYSLNANAKTYHMPPVGHWATAKASDRPVVTNTGEQRIILGYHCTKYILTPKENLPNMRTVYWMTTEIKGLDMKTMPTPGAGGNISQSPFHQDISGIPMLIEVTTPMFNMSIEAASVTRQKVSADAFVIPADFKESK